MALPEVFAQDSSIPRVAWRPQLTRLRLPWIPLTILLVMVICALFAPVLAPYDPTSINMLGSRLAPLKDTSHILGTDVLGRDMLSRLIFGARTSMEISLVALATGALVGTLLGLISGYKGGWLDALIMRTVDAALGFPTILVAMIIVVLWGTGIASVMLAVAMTVWARFARMIRGDVLSIKEMDFVIAARIAGLSTPIIILRHIFPSTVNTLTVITSLQVGQVILLEASLSFLGLGLPPGAPAWGIMVAEGRPVILDVWWLSLLPGLAITIVVLALNFFGDWLRDTLDPRLRRM
jgi:peptide/nickel transport system permease protein